MEKRLPAFTLLLASLLLFFSCNRPLLDERFLDKRLENWTVIDDPDTVEIPSQWHVEDDGWLHQSSNIWGRRGDFLGRWYGTMIVAGEANWSDYHLSVTAKPEDDDGFGVVFRFQDSEHFYRLIFLNDSLSGGPLARLDKRDGADYTEIWAAKKGYKMGVETLIEVAVKGAEIRGSVDGQQLFSVTDDSYKRGKIGLFCYAQSQQAFDNVRVSND
ncbi:MAG: hypothetical protein HY231_20470 [Acidobacteria bacterium]|nr:hypothetical protein [Acidobacteriota bacterium]